MTGPDVNKLTKVNNLTVKVHISQQVTLAAILLDNCHLSSFGNVTRITFFTFLQKN